MGAERLREAAARIRKEQDVEENLGHIGERVYAAWLAVADWLDTAGADLWAHGPLHCADGCIECDDDMWMPHVRRALAVANTYLGTTDA